MVKRHMELNNQRQKACVPHMRRSKNTSQEGTRARQSTYPLAPENRPKNCS